LFRSFWFLKVKVLTTRTSDLAADAKDKEAALQAVRSAHAKVETELRAAQSAAALAEAKVAELRQKLEGAAAEAEETLAAKLGRTLPSHGVSEFGGGRDDEKDEEDEHGEEATSETDGDAGVSGVSEREPFELGGELPPSPKVRVELSASAQQVVVTRRLTFAAIDSECASS